MRGAGPALRKLRVSEGEETRRPVRVVSVRKQCCKTGPWYQAVGGRRISAGFLEEAAAELGLEDLAVREVSRGDEGPAESGRGRTAGGAALVSRHHRPTGGRDRSPGEVAMGMGLNWTP